MRFSGLSIGDAATLRCDAIKDSDLTLRRAKSGELVMLYLPDLVHTALARVKRLDHNYFFWTGTSQPYTAANYWRTRLNLVASRAAVKDFRTHRLRDTFAVELLLADVPMQDVSALLGHSSLLTTERYYAPWNESRRNRLSRVLRDAYKCDPSVLEFDGFAHDKNKTGAALTAPINSSASRQDAKLITKVK